MRSSIKRGRNAAFHFNQKTKRFSLELTGHESLIAVVFLLICIPGYSKVESTLLLLACLLQITSLNKLFL